jgi:hypothetical protein
MASPITAKKLHGGQDRAIDDAPIAGLAFNRAGILAGAVVTANGCALLDERG